MQEKPFAEACEQNKQPILAVLQIEFAQAKTVLEIGSGTGQHAVYMAERLPWLDWYASDLAEHHAGIALWMQDAGLANLHGPYELNVDQASWPLSQADVVFSANTAHIMSEASTLNMLAGVARLLTAGGRFCLYGPFMYDGRHTSDSNARFDLWLKARDPRSGVRDAVKLQRYAEPLGLRLVRDHEMPVNNRILVWEKTPAN